jgi:flagellar hook assembly protein FlgD
MYEVPKASHVTIRIFDMLGREVRTVVDASTQPARYQVVWDGTNTSGHRVASGFYVYRISARAERGNELFFSTKKMILLK